MKINKGKLKNRKIKKGKKRGMFFTLGVVMVMLSLLTMVSISDKTTKIYQDIAIDRTFELSKSVENCILEIFYTYSDLNVSIVKNSDDTTNVTFSEKISSDRDVWGKEFFEVMNEFYNFIQSEEEDLELNMIDLENKTLPLVVKPHNISYARTWQGGHAEIHVWPQDPGNINYQSYEILVDGGDDLTFKRVDFSPGDAGTFYLKVIGRDNLGNSETHEAKVNILTGDGTAFIKWEKGNDFKIWFNDDGEIEMWATEDIPVIVDTKIGNLDSYDQKVKITLYESVINYTLPNLDVGKLTDVVIEES